MKFYYRAEKYYGGDGPITYLFSNKKDRDDYVAREDYCNKAGKIREDHIYDDAGNHFGIFVINRNGKLYEEITGEEI